MKRLTLLHVDISKKINTLLALIITSSFFFTSSIYADEKWKMDKELSTISFELPVLFAKKTFRKFWSQNQCKSGKTVKKMFAKSMVSKVGEKKIASEYLILIYVIGGR